VSCPTEYFPEAPSINFWRSLVYGLGVLKTSLEFQLQRIGLIDSRLFTGASQDRLPILTEFEVRRLFVGGEAST
jgi:hypothetical protein